MKIPCAHTVRVSTTFIFGHLTFPIFSKCRCHTSALLISFYNRFLHLLSLQETKWEREEASWNATFQLEDKNFVSRNNKISRIFSTLPHWKANWMINYSVFKLHIQYLCHVIVLICFDSCSTVASFCYNINEEHSEILMFTK